MKIDKPIGRSGLALLLVAVAATAATFLPATPGTASWEGRPAHGGHGGHGGSGGELLRDLVQAYLASAPYHSIDRAIADGWDTDVTGCLDFPEGHMGSGPGAMGHHYLNPEHIGDTLDVRKPQILLYETLPGGQLRLTGVEYIIPGDILPPGSEPPVLFGQEVMYDEVFGVWGLHVWLWKPNPYGLFAHVNPRVTCRYAS